MYISKGYIRGIKKEKIEYIRKKERTMRVIMNVALWLLGIVAMLIGVCFIFGICEESMIWTFMSKPIGFALCYVAYKCMVWSGFSEPINDTEEA
jgi:hypothetical protein